jgi:transposase-like protein
MFPVSYRDLELMLAGRSVAVAHTTLFRWTQTYAPEIEKRIRRICARATAPGGSTRPSSG